MVSLPHHVAAIAAVVSRFERRQQVVVVGLLLAALDAATSVTGVELLVALGVLLVLDVVLDACRLLV